MLGALSTREYQDLVAKKPKMKDEADVAAETNIKYDSLDEGEFHWDTELVNHGNEKSLAFKVLAQFVP